MNQNVGSRRAESGRPDQGRGGNCDQSETIDLSKQMEGILELMQQRARGQVDNDAPVESAVQNILAAMGAKAPEPATAKAKDKKKSARRLTPAESKIQLDTDNYDEDVENDEQGAETTTVAQKGRAVSVTKSRSKKKRRVTAYTKEEYREILDDIPMGLAGSQMMTAFGDGPQPDPEALKLALEGVRKTLQYSIMDARVLRRRDQQQFRSAQRQALSGIRKLEKEQRSATGEADPDLVYRAMLSNEEKRHDPLMKQHPCGFDIIQLKTLYPEEARAYDRWNELHAEYEKKAASKKPVKKADADDDEEDEAPPSPDETEEEAEMEYLGGHLKERAAAFDVRTDTMEQDHYLQFSRIRQGSFLPRRRQRTQLELEWEALQNTRGGQRRGSWVHMPAIAVRFLHWLGFDPPEVPPPDNETTEVLAFLGHDRLGRIVEKAVYLRKLKEEEEYGTSLPPSTWRELSQDEQLTKADIEKALEDPDVKPIALFPILEERDEDKKKGRIPNVQLYFGPDFEKRLELEMEEMMAGSELAKEDRDREILEQEKQFFEKLSKRRTSPEKDGLASLLEKSRREAEHDSFNDNSTSMGTTSEVKSGAT